MTIAEKAAYLKGLADGLGMDPGSPDGKLWTALTDLLGDAARRLEEHDAAFNALEKKLDEVYDELIYLQELSLPEDEFETDEDDESYLTPPLRLYQAEETDEEEDEKDDEIDADADEDDEVEYDGILYEVTCPGCGETITIDEETLSLGSIHCPQCHETLEFDLGGDDDGETD